jgi:hypothetical protein
MYSSDFNEFFFQQIVISLNYVLVVHNFFTGVFFIFASCINSRSKAIPITGRGSLQGCEMLRIPHCVNSQL